MATVINFATGVPRITNKGLLVEEARTNLVLRSTDQSNAAWFTAGTCVVTANAGVAPDGTMTAAQLASNAGQGRYSTAFSITSGLTYTTTACFKLVSGGPNLILVVAGQAVFGGSGGDRTLVFNASTGAFVSKSTEVSTYSIVSLGNGWWRVSGTWTATASASAQMALYCSTAAVYLTTGAQVEAGAFPTSDIPTTSASATRGADTAKMTKSPGASGTIIATFRVPTDKNTRRVVGSNGASGVAPLSLSTAGIETYNGSSTLAKTVAMTVGALVTVGVTWASGRRSVTGAGLAVATDANSIGSFTELWFGQDDSLIAANALNEYITRIRVMDTAVTDAELQALTA